MTRWIDGLEQEAERLLPDAVARYFGRGSGLGLSAAEAERSWRDVRLRPHVLRDVTTVSTGTSLLGTPVAAPIAIAPTTLQRHADDGGEVAMARGAGAAGSLVCVSSNAGSTFADVAKAGAPWWLQVYVLSDRELTAGLLVRAVDAGARAVVLTVDTPVVGGKDDVPSVWDETPRDYLHANLDAQLASSADHLELVKATDLGQDTVAWLADATGLPVVVKGVLRGDDAAAAVAAGASAVWVSNHGGRQLDQAVAPRVALAEVAATVGDRAQIYVDGGVRRGVDVLIARALGADAVFVGRPPLWALTVAGSDGVARLLRDLADELATAMRLAGCARLDEVTADLVVGAQD